LWNESFFSAPQLKRDSLGSLTENPMTRDRILVVGSAIAVLVIVVGAPILLGRLDFFDSEPPTAGTVLASRLSPDSVLAAAVIATDSAGHYVFVLRKDNEIVAQREISAPVGYHAQIVRVEWTPDGNRAIASIDFDFGERNVRDTLARPILRKASWVKLPNRRLKLAARVDCGMSPFSARRSLSAIR